MRHIDRAMAPLWVLVFILPFTHTVALRLLALFAAFGVGLWAWRARGIGARLAALPALRWIAIWALLPLLLAGGSFDPAYSLGEWKTEVVYGMLALVAAFLLVDREARLRSMLNALFLAFGYLTLSALASRGVHGLWVDESRFGGTATFSAYMVTVLPMLLPAWVLGIFGSWTRTAVPALAILGLAAGLATTQRGMVLALGAEVLVLIVLLRSTGLWRPPARLFWAAVASVALAAALGVVAAVYTRYDAGVDVVAFFAADPRLHNWARVAQWIWEAPLTGHGFGRGMMAKAIPEVAQRPAEDWFWHAHNVVLNYAIQLGIAGMVALLGVFAALAAYWLQCCREPDRATRAIGVAGAMLVAGVFVRNMTNDLFLRDLALLFWVLTGALAGFAHARRAQ